VAVSFDLCGRSPPQRAHAAAEARISEHYSADRWIRKHRWAIDQLQKPLVAIRTSTNMGSQTLYYS